MSNNSFSDQLKIYSEQINFWFMDIHTAASLGDVSFFVKYDVGKLKAQICNNNKGNWTPLMYACARGCSLLVNYLLLTGAKKECKTTSGVTPLMLAISSGNISTVELIFDSSDIEKVDYRKWTALFYAIHFTREKCLNYLIIKGSNVNIVDFQNETPLMAAIKLGRETMVELILQSATNLNVVSFKQESALMLANESNNLKIKLMVKKKNEYLLRQKNVLKFTVNNSPVLNDPTHIKISTPTFIKKKISGQIKIGKSLTYSPNKCPQASSIGSVIDSPWKLAISKKFWSPQIKNFNDVQQFLIAIGLEKYWPIFKDEEVDFETLLTLNENNLKDLGITQFGPRRKIIKAIQQLRAKYQE